MKGLKSNQCEHVQNVSGWVQALEKHFLAEGSKMVMVALETSFNQGVYGLVSTLGSIVVRTLFQPIEEAAFLAFSRPLQGGSQGSPEKGSMGGSKKGSERGTGGGVGGVQEGGLQENGEDEIIGDMQQAQLLSVIVRCVSLIGESLNFNPKSLLAGSTVCGEESIRCEKGEVWPVSGNVQISLVMQVEGRFRARRHSVVPWWRGRVGLGCSFCRL